MEHPLLITLTAVAKELGLQQGEKESLPAFAERCVAEIDRTIEEMRETQKHLRRLIREYN